MAFEDTLTEASVRFHIFLALYELLAKKTGRVPLVTDVYRVARKKNPWLLVPMLTPTLVLIWHLIFQDWKQSLSRIEETLSNLEESLAPLLAPEQD